MPSSFVVERRKKKRTQLSYEKVPATVGTGEEEQQTRMKESSKVVLLTQGTAIVEVVAALL